MPVNVDALRELGNRVIAEVRALKASGQLAKRRQRYVIRPNLNLWYSVDATLMNFETKTVEEDDWHWKALEPFLTKEITTEPAYAQVTEALQGSGGNTNLVRAFVSRVAHDAGLSTDPALDQHIAAMLRDATDSPQEYQAKIWLTGITLAEEVISVSDALSLRRPTRHDFEDKVRTEDASHSFAMSQGRIYFSCIADCKVQVRRPVDLQRHVSQLVTALSLFRLGSVSAARYDYHAQSFSIFANGILGGPQRAPRITYALSTDDQPKLQRALRILMPLIPSVYDVPDMKPNFLSTALAWYSESLLAGGAVQGTVAWAVACLEALFLGDNPNTELSYRLTQRVIALLRCFGWAPLNIRQVLRTAYDVRSKHVHGAVPKKLSNEALTTLHRTIAEYARVACLVWAQILTERKRSEVLATLEEALIDDAANLRLQQWCNGVDLARRPW